MLLKAGIDISLFSQHITRSAATSAQEKQSPVNTILNTISWQKECTFRKLWIHDSPKLATLTSKVDEGL